MPITFLDLAGWDFLAMIETLSNFSFHCTKCGLCCNYPGLLVNVTPRDMRLLAKHLKADAVAMLKAVAFYQVEPVKEMDAAKIQDRMVFPPVKTHKGMAYLCLLKKPDGQCVFLKDNKCTIYPARPRICQSFPFTFKHGSQGVSVLISTFAASSCPGIGKGEHVNVDKVKETGRAILQEIDEMASFTNWWNNRTGDDPDLFKPARLVDEMIRFKHVNGGHSRK